MLSKYFALSELTVSETAARRCLKNTPFGKQLENLRQTAQRMDEIREGLGKPVIVTSGYRSPEVNAAWAAVAQARTVTDWRWTSPVPATAARSLSQKPSLPAASSSTNSFTSLAHGCTSALRNRASHRGAKH